MRNLGTSAIRVPDNPVYIDFSRTDGNRNTWPANTTCVVDNDGHVNWMDPLANDHPTVINWRIKIGWAIAADMGLEGGDDAILRNWPEGYRMFDHNKGPAHTPRHDVYLFGAPAKRFRSVNEFIPHAIWLMRDETLSPQNCVCKYCSKKAQKEITAAMTSILRTTPSNSQSPTPSRTQHQSAQKKRDLYTKLQKELKSKREQPRVFAAVQKRLKPLKPSPNVSTYPMLVERNHDLRSVYAKSANGEGVMALRKWFRENEIVWCALNPGIRVPGREGVKIGFWPGVVEQARLKAVPIPSSISGNTNGSASSLSSHTQPPPLNTADQDERGIVIEPSGDEPPLPWTVKQSITYRIRFLAVSASLDIADDRVLPYQAHAPPNDLISALQAIPPSSLDFDKDKIALFDPCKCAKEMDELILREGDAGPSQQTNFFEAAAAYALAVQIAATISGYWSLTDEWKFKYVVPGPSLGHPPSYYNSNPTNATASTSNTISAPGPALPSRSHLSLHSAIEAASRNNAQSSPQSLASTYNPTHFDVSGTDPNMHEDQVRQLASHVLGVPMQTDSASINGNFVNKVNPNLSESHGTTLVQTRYQGMWWGAERIWVDDFIRLKVQRGSFAPKGAPNISPPAGPSAIAKSRWAETYGKDEAEEPNSIGAWTRGVFMRLDGLMVVDVPKGEGGRTRKEGRACGMLYELVDEDWEDDGGSVKDNGKGKGKEREVDTTPFNVTLNPVLLPPTSNGSASFSKPAGTSVPPPSDRPPKALQSSPPPSYLLPQAPRGYRFRSILSPGYEAVVNMALISGRYYPRILFHPLLEGTVQEALRTPLGHEMFQHYDNLWALEGLAAGYHNTVDPVVYKKSRVAMVQDADKEAGEQLEMHKEGRIKEEEGDDDVQMASDDELQLSYPGRMDVDIL